MNKLLAKLHILHQNPNEEIKKKEKHLLDLTNRLSFIDILLFILWSGAILSVVMMVKTLFFGT